MCLTGIDSSSPVAHARVNGVSASTTSTPTWRQTKRSDRLGSSAPGSRPASQSTWKPLQMPSTGPPSRGERRDLLHDRREAGDRPDAQVVAVGEAAGDDDRVDALQVVVAVPEQHRLADALAGGECVRLVAGPGKLDDAEPHAGTWAGASRIS